MLSLSLFAFIYFLFDMILLRPKLDYWVWVTLCVYISPQVRGRQVAVCVCFSLVGCRRISPLGVGVAVLSRHVRLCAFDGSQVLNTNTQHCPTTPTTYSHTRQTHNNAGLHPQRTHTQHKHTTLPYYTHNALTHNINTQH